MKKLVTITVYILMIITLSACSTESTAPTEKVYSIEYIDIEQGSYMTEIEETLSAFPQYIQDELNNHEVCIYVCDTTDILYKHCNNDQVSSKEERGILGCYIDTYENIYLIMGNLDYDAERIDTILSHEIGHFIWERILTEADREVFTEIYNTNEVYIFSEAVNRKYCTESAEEYFCELVAVYYYIEDPAVINSLGIPLSAEFINGVLGD